MTSTRHLLKAMEVVRSFDDKMPIQRLTTFLFVVGRGRASREEVASSLGQSLGSAYRNLMALSDQEYSINIATKQGIGWLTFQHDVADEPRRLVWTVASRGQRVVDQLEGILNGE